MGMAEIVRGGLIAEGYWAELDVDGDVTFTHEGLNFAVLFDADDPEYYQLVLPNFWPLESDEERRAALAACDDVNRAVKLVKLYTVQDNVWGGVESAYEAPEQFLNALPRALTFLQDAARAFRDAMIADQVVDATNEAGSP